MVQHGKHRALVRARACLCALALTSSAAAAAEWQLALGASMDVLSSVEGFKDVLQRGGWASALIVPEMEAAVFASSLPVAMSIYEWSGRSNQELLLDWRPLSTQADLLSAVKIAGRSKRSHNACSTALGCAPGYGAGRFERGSNCLSSVVNLAGDGEKNEGGPPTSAFAEFPFENVTANGLATQASDYLAEISPVRRHQKCTLHRAGSFLESARGFENYEHAMARTLERKVTPPAMRTLNHLSSKAPG